MHFFREIQIEFEFNSRIQKIIDSKNLRFRKKKGNKFRKKYRKFNTC